MADQKNRARIVTKQILQQIQCLDIEIIGRFVQDQKIAFARHDFGKHQPRPLAPREGAHRRARLRLVKQEIFEIAHHMAGAAAHHDLIRGSIHGNLTIQGQAVPQTGLRVQSCAVLIKHRHLKAFAQGDMPRVRGKLACQHIQKRGFACAIWADKPHPIPAQNAQIKGFQNLRASKGF